MHTCHDRYASIHPSIVSTVPGSQTRVYGLMPSYRSWQYSKDEVYCNSVYKREFINARHLRQQVVLWSQV